MMLLRSENGYRILPVKISDVIGISLPFNFVIAEVFLETRGLPVVYSVHGE